ncbi:MAG TPA: hypothetical protein VJK54_06265, partial [Chthoniobacterales bacterium]|nr:hypothetical protein [Chthoniobacterales bacterium]
MLKYILFLFLLLSTQLGATSLSNIETSKPEALPLFSSLSLNLASNPTLAMNPLTVEETLQEGITALKRGLSFSEVAESNPRSFTTIRTELGLPERSSPVSHEVLRLRGGGPKSKFSSSTEALKSTGDSDDEPDEESSDTNQYLKNEICDNIYAACLAKVTKISLREREAAQGGQGVLNSDSAEVQEWAAAERAAVLDHKKAEFKLNQAKEETIEAKEAAVEAKKVADEIEKRKSDGTDSFNDMELRIAYEKARMAYTASDYKAKRLAQKFSEARVETALAVIKAISVRNSAHSAEAEIELADAKETEMQALEAVDAAKADVAVKA